jgi:hypothetical protein
VLPADFFEAVAGDAFFAPLDVFAALADGAFFAALEDGAFFAALEDDPFFAAFAGDVFFAALAADFFAAVAAGFFVARAADVLAPTASASRQLHQARTRRSMSGRAASASATLPIFSTRLVSPDPSSRACVPGMCAPWWNIRLACCRLFG